MSSQTPEVRFAESGEVDIAYQVVGRGPLDLVLVAGAFTHLRVLWEQPRIAVSVNGLLPSRG